MLKVLISAKLASLKSWATGASIVKKQKSKFTPILYTMLFIYVAIALLFMLFGYFWSLAEPFNKAGLGWLYFAMFAITDFALMFIGSVFSAKSQLFEAKDNQILLSMPIKPSDILLSRMSVLLIINFVLDIIVALPAGISWLMACPVTAVGTISFIIVVLLLPLLSLSASSLFGWLLSVLTSRIRRKALMTTVFSIAFLAAYFYGVSQMSTGILKLAQNGSKIAAGLRGIAPIYWIGSAIADENMLYLLLSAIIMVVPFIITYFVLSKTFFHTVTTQRGFAKIKYVEKTHKSTGLSTALYRKEAGRLFSSSMYFMNTCLGAIFMIIGGAAVIVFKDKIDMVSAMIPQIKEYISTLLTLALCMMAGMSNITAPSVSIEGKSIWIVRSIPASAEDVLKAKLKLHCSIIASVGLVASICVVIATKPDILQSVMCILIPPVFSVFTGIVGLLANLRHPDFNWKDETAAVKNSVAVLINIGITWAVILAAILIGYFWLWDLISAGLYLTGLFVAVSIATVLLYRSLMTTGVKLFDEL